MEKYKTHVVFWDKLKKIRFSVVPEFLVKCQNPEDFTDDELNEKYAAFAYLHHPTEPAVFNTYASRMVYSYWIDRKCIPYAEAKEMAHRTTFGNRLESALTDSDVSEVVKLMASCTLDHPEEYIKEMEAKQKKEG